MSQLLPPNSTPQERAFSGSVEYISKLPVQIRSLIDPETCPLAILPWLAWELSVDEWDTNWSEARKRAAVKASIEIHQRKGTIGAMKSALGALGYQMDVKEWFELPEADPYTFGITITVDQEGIPNAAAYDQIVAVAESAKNARSRMWGVDVKAISRGALSCAAVCFMGETITIQAEPT